MDAHNAHKVSATPAEQLRAEPETAEVGGKAHSELPPPVQKDVAESTAQAEVAPELAAGSWPLAEQALQPGPVQVEQTQVVQQGQAEALQSHTAEHAQLPAEPIETGMPASVQGANSVAAEAAAKGGLPPDWDQAAVEAQSVPAQEPSLPPSLPEPDAVQAIQQDGTQLEQEAPLQPVVEPNVVPPRQGKMKELPRVRRLSMEAACGSPSRKRQRSQHPPNKVAGAPAQLADSRAGSDEGVAEPMSLDLNGLAADDNSLANGISLPPEGSGASFRSSGSSAPTVAELGQMTSIAGRADLAVEKQRLRTESQPPEGGLHNGQEQLPENGQGKDLEELREGSQEIPIKPEDSAEAAVVAKGQKSVKAPKAKRQRRSAQKQAAAVTRPPEPLIKEGTSPMPETPLLQKIMDKLHANQEPYHHVEWRRQPWSVRAYQTIDSYQVAGDAGEAADIAALPTKLLTGCGQLFSAASADAAEPPAEDSTAERMEVDTGKDAHRGAGRECSTSGRGSLEQQLQDPFVRCVRVDTLPPPLEFRVDVEERPAWGLDCYTHRALSDALMLCPALHSAEQDPEERQAACHCFIESKLLPAINQQWESGWNISLALAQIAEDSPKGKSPADAAAARHLQWAVAASEAQQVLLEHRQDKAAKAAGIPAPLNSETTVLPEARKFWRIHPKGQGIFCCREDGISKGTLVAEYLGELYSPWRWFEKQDLMRKRNPNQALPDFYNISLERPTDDPAGYDVVFVEAADRGNFASRLSHSCGPNCRNVSVVVGGRLTNALFTTRDVAFGEELCWDYACVTESEREFRAATCLCASPSCRGSFLYYANSSTFQEVMTKRHGFLDRNALLVRACSQDVTAADATRLRTHGIGSSVLGPSPPAWLLKWAALVLEYIELEARELPAALQTKYGHEELAARLQAEGVKENRLSNLAITLDKAAFFLRHQPPALQNEPPLQVLTDDRVVAALWTGPESLGRRACEAAKKALSSEIVRAVGNGRDRAIKGRAIIQELQSAQPPASAAEARALLLELASTLRAQGDGHLPLADVLTLLGHTALLFTATQYQSVKSSIHNGPAKGDPLPGSGSAGGKKSQKAAGKGGEAKIYRPTFLWGQLLAWYKQTVFDPSASLSADRRGVLSLPDLETTYNMGKGSYKSKHRAAMLSLITRAPSNMWPTSFPFSFKNAARLYGSPMLDAALRAAQTGASGEDLAADAQYGALLEHLRLQGT